MKDVTIKFDVYNKDKKVARVEVVDGNLIKNEAYTTDIWEYFWIKIKDAYNMLNAISSRVFDKNRPDRDEILAHYGLSEYNVFNIIKHTHGIMLSDYIWFKFDDDPKGLCWEDLVRRYQ